MKIYFLSAIPCMLLVNGGYFGHTHHHAQFAEINLADNLFIEFIPENAHPIRFFLTENLRFTPPQGCDVYLLKDGVAIEANDFFSLDYTLRLIAQKRLSLGLVTLFQQGLTQVSIENDDLIVTPIPPLKSAEIYACGEGIVLVGERLVVLSSKGELLFDKAVESYQIEDGLLHVAYPLADSLSRTAKGVCKITDRLEWLEYSLIGEKEPTLFAYAFLESLLFGGDFTHFLSNELRQQADKLPEFFGEFCDVVPTEQENCVGIVKRKAPRLFEVAYYTFTVEEGKISDIQG